MTNNNPEEVENLIKNGYISNTPNPDDYVVVTAVGKAKGKRSKSNRYPNTKYVVPVSALGGGINGPVCDITMEQKGITFGPEVTVSVDWNIQPPITDVIIPGQLELYCEPFMNVWFNTVDMSQPDWNTQYTGGPWGFKDLSDIESRTYATWNIFSSVNEETVLYHAPSNTYWAIYFTSYDFRNGFTYTRRQIFLPELCKLTFSDGSVLDSAKDLVTGSAVTQVINPDGTVTYVVAGSELAYANVVFVDSTNGDNLTGLINNASKPFASINTARNAALPVATSLTNRALVYIRKGTYISGANYMYLANYVDFYCEPGVVLQDCRIDDLGAAVNSNVYGYVKMYSWSNTVVPVNFVGGSTITFEFDWISSQAAAMYIAPNTTGSRIVIKGNYIYSSTLGNGFGISIRNSANVTMNIAHAIDAPHSTFAFRFFTGDVRITCPNINLVAGNAYGGNYKQALIIYDGSSVGSIVVNGNIRVTDTIDYGGIGSAVTFWAGAQVKLTINGNIYGGPIKALDGNTHTAGSIEINGNMSSSKDYTVWAYGSGQIVIKNSTIINNGTVANYAVAINGTAKVFFKDCYLVNNQVDSNVVVVNGVTTVLVLDNCQAYSPGASGSSISSTVGPVNVRVHSSRFNKAVTADITDLYAPSGIIVDPNLITPTLIN